MDGERPLHKVVSVMSDKKQPPPPQQTQHDCCLFFISPAMARLMLLSCSMFSLRCQSRLGGLLRNQGGILYIYIPWPLPGGLPDPLFQPNVGSILRSVIEKVNDGVMLENTQQTMTTAE